jgi:hypothetical protein
MTPCGVVYIILAEVAGLDRLERCDRESPCPEHTRQLDWVRSSFPRLVAYDRQVADYDAARRRAAAAEELSLL